MALFGKKKKKKEAAAEGAEGEAAAEKDEKKEEEKKDGAEEKKEDKKEGDAPKEGEGGEAAEGEAPAEGGGKKSKKKLIIMAAAGVLVLALVGGGAAFFLMGKKAPEGDKGEKPAAEVEKPTYFDLPQILVNLNTGNKGPSFIKATVTLELTKPEDIPLAQANLPRLLDSYNSFLREMKTSDLYGSAGMYRLREEMLLRANTLLAPVKVRDVLFKEILVQ